MVVLITHIGPRNSNRFSSIKKGTPADIGGQTAGALAIMYLNYKSIDSIYANKCLTAAKNYFNLVKSSTQISDSGGFYSSNSYKDDLAWVQYGCI